MVEDTFFDAGVSPIPSVEVLDGTNDVIASDLSIGYPAHGGGSAFAALEGVSFHIPRSSVMALLGESGSGKSTLARYIAARGQAAGDRGSRLKTLSGDALVLGSSLAKLNRKSQAALFASIGYLPQDAGAKLSPDLVVSDLLLEPVVRAFKRVDLEEQSARMVMLLEKLALPLTVLDQFPYQLSKGQRQRVAVARSLMLKPQLLVLDEPTMGIDPTSRPKVIELLAQYLDESEASALVISHDIALLEQLVDSVSVLQNGELVGSGALDAIFAEAEHGYVRKLAEALRSTAYDEAYGE